MVIKKKLVSGTNIKTVGGESILGSGDTISILNFAYDTVENEMFVLVKVERSLDIKADKVIPASTEIPKLKEI